MQLKPSLPLQAVSSHGKCFSASKLNLRASALHHFLLAPTPWTQRADSAPHSSLGDVWPLLSPLPSWLPAPNAPKLFKFWSSGVAPQTGVTCNHSLFHWIEEEQTPESLHMGQFSLHRIGKVGKTLQNRVLITVVAYWQWLQITCFWWRYPAILYLNHSIFFELLSPCFEIVCSWQITGDCHWLCCILFIFSSPTLWFRHFRDVPAEKMPDPRWHSWN